MSKSNEARIRANRLGLEAIVFTPDRVSIYIFREHKTCGKELYRAKGFKLADAFLTGYESAIQNSTPGTIPA